MNELTNERMTLELDLKESWGVQQFEGPDEKEGSLI